MGRCVHAAGSGVTTHVFLIIAYSSHSYVNRLCMQEACFKSSCGLMRTLTVNLRKFTLWQSHSTPMVRKHERERERERDQVHKRYILFHVHVHEHSIPLDPPLVDPNDGAPIIHQLSTGWSEDCSITTVLLSLQVYMYMHACMNLHVHASLYSQCSVS